VIFYERETDFLISNFLNNFQAAFLNSFQLTILIYVFFHFRKEGICIEKVGNKFLEN
jgi:hypothetical protein